MDGFNHGSPNVNREDIPKFLPAILGVMRQELAEGVLSLEQNDGQRRLYWTNGDLVFLQSDVAGEQFGNYLLRQGILDLPALNEILADSERRRLGDRVVQAGLMTRAERDEHLQYLQAQIMVHALEHPVIEMRWEPGPIGIRIDLDLQFKVDHHRFIWKTFQETRNLGDICDLLYAETSWKWEAPRELLAAVSDLPLNPKWAYALTFLGAEPIGFETFISLGNLEEEDAARLIVTLWALGSLTLSRGDIPMVARSPWKSRSAALPDRPAQTEGAPSPQLAARAPKAPTPNPVSPPISSASATNPPPVPIPKVERSPAPTAVMPPSAPPQEEPFRDAAARLAQAAATPIPQPAALEPVESPEPLSDDASNRARRFYKKAAAYALQERMSEAIRLLEQSVQLDPDSEAAFDAWMLLGKLRLANPAWSSRAIDALQRASRLRASAGEPWALMGELYQRKGFQTNAVACYRRALELDPSIPVPDGIAIPQGDEAAKDAPGILGRLGNSLKAILARKDGED